MTFNTKTIGALIVALIVGFGIGHYTTLGGAKTAAPRGAFTANGTRGTFQMRVGGAQANGGFLTGSIVKVENGSLTLSTRDGSSHVVLLSPDTSVLKSVEGATSDLKAGDTVIVTGSANSDGSLSAQSVQIRPAGTDPAAPGTGAPMIPAPLPQ